MTKDCCQWTLDYYKLMEQKRLMMFSLNMVSTLIFVWTSKGDHSESVLLFGFCFGNPPSFLKVGGWVVAYRILVSAPVPLVLIGFLNWVELGWTGLGLGLGVLGIRFWGQGLTIFQVILVEKPSSRVQACQVILAPHWPMLLILSSHWSAAGQVQGVEGGGGGVPAP